MNDHDQKTGKMAVGEYCEAKLEKLAIQDELPKTKRAFRANHFSDDIRDGFKENVKIKKIINIIT